MRIIRKEVVIDAPVEKVWEHVTDPGKIAGWLMPNDFEATVGRPFQLDCDQEGMISCVVRELVRLQKLVYSFTSKEIRVETLVTIRLLSEDGGTRVILEHSGWDVLPPSDQGIADQFENGWVSKLGALQVQIEIENQIPRR